MNLIDTHIADLRRSALSDETIESMACRSVLGAEDIAKISTDLVRCDSLLEFPYPTTTPDFRRWKLFPQLGKMKYFQQPGTANHLYILPTLGDRLFETKIPLYIIEGEKKAACLVQYGYTAVGIGGLWNWKETDDWEAIEEFKVVPLALRDVVIVPDSDVWVQKRVDLQRAIYSLGAYLEECGANVSFVVLPQGNEKCGADDYFAARR